MKSEHVQYLQSLGLSEILIERAKAVEVFYKTITNHEIDDVVVSEYLQPDGSRVYEGFWLFAGGYVLEAKSFAANDDYDLAPIKKSVRYWNIKKTDYDFNEATDNSRLTVRATLGMGGLGGVSIEIKASKKNCDHLKAIFLKYIIANHIQL